MDFNRPEAKRQARASMRGIKPSPLLVALIFIIATTGISELVSFLLNTSQFDLYMDFINYVDAGYDPIEVMEYLITAIPTTGLLSTVTSLFLTIYTTVMGAGYTSYALRLARHENPSYRNLLDGFHMVGRVILMNILQWVFIFLWTFVAIIPGIIVLVVGLVMDSPLVVGLAVVLYLAGIIFSFTVSYRYRLSIYFLLDNPEMGAHEAITSSKNTMAGRKRSLFTLDVSFFGWLLLSLCTFGILSIWLLPYMYTAEAIFYDIAVHGRYSAPEMQQPPL